MKNNNERYAKVEWLLRQAKPSDASAPTKARTMDAAKRAWEQTQTDIPWQVPLRRLAGSAVAALVLISLANNLGSWVVPKPVDRAASASEAYSADPEDFYLAEYGIVVTVVPASSYRSSAPGGLTVSDYMEQLQEMLDEDRARESRSQPPGRSRLVPAAPEQSWS